MLIWMGELKLKLKMVKIIIRPILGKNTEQLQLSNTSGGNVKRYSHS